MGRDPGAARMNPAYTGPFEVLSSEEAALRCRCSLAHFEAVYDGPRCYVGEGQSLLRFPAWALHEWINARCFVPGEKGGATAWDTVGNGTKPGEKVDAGLPARSRRKGG